MRFTPAGRRKQRLERLLTQLAVEDEAELRPLMAKATDEELAHVLSTLPLDRANSLLAEVSSDRLKSALALTLSGERRSRSGARAKVDDDDAAQAAEPVCVKALDLAGRLLGR
jgi:hypothetical protein